MCMSYNLAVTYKTVHDGEKYHFSYRGKIYSTKTDMCRQIFKDHPSVDIAKMLLLHIGTHPNEKYKEPCKNVYEKPFPVFEHLKIGTIIVREYYHEKQIVYYCINRIFTNYNLAVVYAHLINLKLKSNPKKHSRVEIPNEINVAKKVGQYGYSNKIWRTVWKGCYYHSCFAEDDFKSLKSRFLTEMNEYRLRHGASIVKIETEFTKLAEKYLDKILNTPKTLLDKRFLRFYVETPYYFAPLIIKNWYDESKYYKHGTKAAKSRTEHFTTMVWKGLKHVGFAVKEKDDMIYFVAVFEPKPNDHKLFSNNVKRKKSFSSG